MKLTARINQVQPSPTLSLDAKAKALKASGADVISFGAGEPDFPTPTHIKEAGIRAIQENFTRYTPVGGIPELKNAVVNKFARDNGLEYTPEQIAINCGGKHTLYNLAQVLVPIRGRGHHPIALLGVLSAYRDPGRGRTGDRENHRGQ